MSKLSGKNEIRDWYCLCRYLKHSPLHGQAFRALVLSLGAQSRELIKCPSDAKSATGDTSHKFLSLSAKNLDKGANSSGTLEIDMKSEDIGLTVVKKVNLNVPGAALGEIVQILNSKNSDK